MSQVTTSDDLLKKSLQNAEELGTASAAQLQVLGAQLHQVHQPEAALHAFERAAEKAPEVLEIWLAIATLRLELKLPNAALGACNEAMKLAPDNAQCLYSTGVILSVLSDNAAALHCYERALLIQSDHYGALRNRPMLLAKLGRSTEAQQAASEAISAYPQDPWLCFNQGELLLGMRAAIAAEAAYRQALVLAANFPDARYGLAIALAAQGHVARAYSERAAALAADPTVQQRYRSPLVLDALNGSNDVSPERVAVLAAFEALRVYDWRAYESSTQLYAALVKGLVGNPPLDQHEMPYLALGLPVEEDIRRQVARQAATRVQRSVANIQLLRSPRAENRRISIGYVSANFSPHPSAQLMGEIYARHDRHRFKVHAYSVGPKVESKERVRVQAGVDVFRDLQHYPDRAAAQQIINDGVDILIDLSGFTQGGRPEILALRPASIQVAYLDFMGTQGAHYIDYALLDRHILSTELRPFWDEKIVYLPYCSYHCEMPQESTCAERSEVGLPESVLILGALHHPRKLDPQCFSVWLELLGELPQSALWLLYETDEQVFNLRQQAAAAGIAESRLFFAPLVSHEEHLARLGLIDIFLDTFFYNGHTTTIDSLSVGVPVVTLCGETAVARVAGSMLRAHGLPELIANSIDEYKASVHRLAEDPEWRKEIRRRAGSYEHSNLFCPERRVREIETAYEMMWARHIAGLPPEDFDVPEYQPSDVDK